VIFTNLMITIIRIRIITPKIISMVNVIVTVAIVRVHSVLAL